MDSDGEDTRTDAPHNGRLAVAPGVDPLLKRFIDDVVIPALLDRLSGAPRCGDPPTARPPVSEIRGTRVR